MNTFESLGSQNQEPSSLQDTAEQLRQEITDGQLAAKKIEALGKTHEEMVEAIFADIADIDETDPWANAA